eukprot:2705448-Pleurochrysis_carterae.AAC.1
MSFQILEAIKSSGHFPVDEVCLESQPRTHASIRCSHAHAHARSRIAPVSRLQLQFHTCSFTPAAPLRSVSVIDWVHPAARSQAIPAGCPSLLPCPSLLACPSPALALAS